MPVQFRIAVLLLVVLLPAASASAQPSPADALPTVAQLQEQLAQHKEQEVLRSVSKLLALKGEAAKRYDRYELFSLRGEAYLRTKSIAPAADAFAAAQKETVDPEQKEIARANELLIRRSKPVGYTPKTQVKSTTRPSGAKPNAPLPIVEPADRKEAFAALLVDEAAAVEPKLKAAKTGAGLPPVIEAARTLGDMRAIEMAATGSGEKTTQIGGELGDHAHALIAEAIRSMQTRVEESWTLASKQQYLIDNGGNKQGRLYGLLGLNSTQSNDLKNTIATCDKIIPVAGDLAAVTGGKELASDAQSAEKLRVRAEEVLNYDYNNEGRYTRPPTVRPGAAQ